jgi:hypothetical protein
MKIFPFAAMIPSIWACGVYPRKNKPWCILLPWGWRKPGLVHLLILREDSVDKGRTAQRKVGSNAGYVGRFLLREDRKIL